MKRIKERIPKTITVAGGLMYTAIPREIMQQNSQIDFAIVSVFGDCGYALWEFLEELKKPSPKLSEINGLTYRQGAMRSSSPLPESSFATSMS